MIQQQRVFSGASQFILNACLVIAIGVITFAAASVSHAQVTNLADHVGGYMLGDFENVTTVNLNTDHGPKNNPPGDPYITQGPGYSDQGGLLYNGPASAIVGLNTDNNPTGVWSDFGDIQPQYYNGNSNLLFYQQSTAGATHGSKALQFYNVIGPDTFNGTLELLNNGADLATAAALFHASALKMDVTFDRSLLQNAGANPYLGVSVAINSPGGFNQGNISYDSLSTLDPATLNSTHRVTAQPNNQAGTINYLDTTIWPGTAPTAASYGQSPVVTGTGSITMTLTVDFTKNLQNGAPGNTDGTNPPTWLLKHNSIVTAYNSTASGSFYNIYHIYFSLGDFNAGGLEFDNIRLILPGDFNQDGHVDANDIKAGEAALANLKGYMSTYNMNGEDMNLIGDVNGDNQVTNADLQKLLSNLIAGQGSSAVPEPSSLVLLGAGCLLLAARKRGRFLGRA